MYLFQIAAMIIYKYINRQLGVIICLGGMAAGLFLTPHCPSKTLFFVVGGMLGYFVGSYDATQVVWMIEIWQVHKFQSDFQPFSKHNFCFR